MSNFHPLEVVDRGVGQILEFKNLAKIIILIALLKKNENSRNLNYVKSPKIKNSRKFKHAKPDVQYSI